MLHNLQQPCNWEVKMLSQVGQLGQVASVVCI